MNLHAIKTPDTCAPQKVDPALIAQDVVSLIGASSIECCYAARGITSSSKDIGVHTKMSLNVSHRVVSLASIAERTASLEIRLKALAHEPVYAAAANT